ncbi:hypothetical protein LNP56_28105 [Klebsiella pneumoniae subsp. pneumoniae]|nr:hypothetical protein [Klebsiella pneumoniae subsp. pneumoniae]
MNNDNFKELFRCRDKNCTLDQQAAPEAHRLDVVHQEQVRVPGRPVKAGYGMAWNTSVLARDCCGTASFTHQGWLRLSCAKFSAQAGSAFSQLMASLKVKAAAMDLNMAAPTAACINCDIGGRQSVLATDNGGRNGMNGSGN